MTGRYKAYPEYKDSGVKWIGRIPSHWGLKKLKYLAPLIGEKATEKTNPIALEHIQSWTGKLKTTNSTFEGDGTKFKAGDILFGKLRPYLAKVYLTEADGEAIGDFHVMRPISSSYGNFLKSLMLTTDYISTVDASTYGAKMPRASWDFTSNIQLPFCSEVEAEKIGSFLDHETAKIDTLIAKQEKLIELLKEKRQAVISHAVTKGLNPDAPMKGSGVEWLGEVPEHWDMKRLKYIGEARNGLTYSPDDVVTREEGILVLRSSNIQDARLSFSDNVYVNMDIPTRIRTKENDLLICSRNGSRQLIGKNALITKEAVDMAFGAFMVVFRSKLNPYLYWVLNSPLFEYQSGSFLTSTINQLTIGNLASMEVPIPPECERKAISDYLIEKDQYFDKLTHKALLKVNLLKERKTALISAAVTGKIDVRDEELK